MIWPAGRTQRKSQERVARETDPVIHENAHAKKNRNGGERRGQDFIGDVTEEIKVNRQEAGQQQAEKLRARAAGKDEPQAQKNRGQGDHSASQAEQPERDDTAGACGREMEQGKSGRRNKIIQWRLVPSHNLRWQGGAPDAGGYIGCRKCGPRCRIPVHTGSSLRLWHHKTTNATPTAPTPINSHLEGEGARRPSCRRRASHQRPAAIATAESAVKNKKSGSWNATRSRGVPLHTAHCLCPVPGGLRPASRVSRPRPPGRPPSSCQNSGHAVARCREPQRRRAGFIGHADRDFIGARFQQSGDVHSTGSFQFPSARVGELVARPLTRTEHRLNEQTDNLGATGAILRTNARRKSVVISTAP